ncbi:hypothetical protein BH09BAC1_BH09BAC1_30230 [soil metagenome]
MHLPKLFRCAWLLAVLLISQPLWANDSIYENRRQVYIDSSLHYSNNDVITIQAYVNGAVDTALINELLNQIPAKSTSDFDIVKLVRVLYLTNGAHEALILPALDTIPFWLTKADTLHGYWSENHMIMWMSSNWLLHEKYGFDADTALDTRLRHYLRMKVKYGFYEFFSSVYAPYCLSGLLNLADFSQDVEIKNLATQASVRLLIDLLKVTNDKGVMFAVAGRNYYSKYDKPYGQNHNNLIYLLTGMGEPPVKASHAGGFLATSTLQVDSIISTWAPVIDTLYRIGHSLDSALILHGGQRKLDKTIFLWSGGGYFHPLVAYQTGELLQDSMLWEHVDFKPFHVFATFSPSQILGVSQSLPAISMSSVICGQDVAIFKHHSVTLTSLQDFWKGKISYQQYPCVANVGTTAVYTASGEPKEDWEKRNSNNSNDHLPYITQRKNVALLMYRPEENNILLKSADVALRFRDADFDEVRNDSLWLLGRQENGFVAVRRSCTGMINNVRACETVNGQSWVIVVGDSIMYGSFNNFQNIIAQSQFTEEWYDDSTAGQSIYFASITVDTVHLEYAWGVDFPSSIDNVNKTVTAFKIYPNPTQNVVTVAYENIFSAVANVQVLNMLGQVIYTDILDNPEHQINTQSWPEGVYMIVVEQNGLRNVQRLVKY